MRDQEGEQMKSIDPTIKKETGYIALMVLILSALMEAVYLITGHWDLTVLYGNLLGAFAGILNFFLMGLGLQNSLNKDEKGVKATVSFSYSMRFLLLAVVIILSVVLDIFSTIPAVLSLLFPSIGVFIKAFLLKKNEVKEVSEE